MATYPLENTAQVMTENGFSNLQISRVLSMIHRNPEMFEPTIKLNRSSLDFFLNTSGYHDQLRIHRKDNGYYQEHAIGFSLVNREVVKQSNSDHAQNNIKNPRFCDLIF